MVLKQKLASRISGIILAYVRGKKGRLTIISDDLKPDMAIIDGIKDLMTDINDAVQATLIMEQLIALARRVHPETGITWVELQENTLPF